MTGTEINFLLWGLGVLLAVIAFVGALGVQALIRIANSVNKIEKDLGVLANDHINLKAQVVELKERVYELENP